MYTSSNAKRLIEWFFNKFFWRQHPEAALRYFPVVAAIRALKLEDAKILEVGPGSLGITPYFRRKIDGIDIDFNGPTSPWLNQIKGIATELPFKRNSFDVVISVDVLEHLAKKEREKAIYEVLRVAKKLAVIVVPVGPLSEKQDRELQGIWLKIFGRENQYLWEHVKNGLPKTEEILVITDRVLRRLKKTAKIKSKPNLNLFARYILVRTWITKNKFIYYLYLKGYLLLLPILRLANFGHCYRRVFVIEFVQ